MYERHSPFHLSLHNFVIKNQQSLVNKIKQSLYCSMLSNSLSLPPKNQYLQEKVSFLQQELLEYKQKESKLNRLNESILQTYKQNEDQRQSREQKLRKQNRQIVLRHREQIRKLKSQHSRQKSQLENENVLLKQKLKKMQEDFEHLKLQNQKNLIDLKTTLQNKHSKHIEQIEKNFELRTQQLNSQINQLILTNQMHKEYIEKKQAEYQRAIQEMKPVSSCIVGNKQNFTIQSANRLNQRTTFRNDIKISYPQILPVQDCYLYEIKESNMAAKRVAKSSKKIISELSSRINRAMKQINNDKNYQPY